MDTDKTNFSAAEFKAVTGYLHMPKRHQEYYAWQGNISFKSPLPIQVSNFQDVQFNATVYCEGVPVASINLQSLILTKAPRRTGPIPVFARSADGHLNDALTCFSRVAGGILTRLQVKDLVWISTRPNHAWLNEVLKGLEVKINIQLKDANMMKALKRKSFDKLLKQILWRRIRK